MHAPENVVFEFGDFILARAERLLLCGGQPIPLMPRRSICWLLSFAAAGICSAKTICYARCGRTRPSRKLTWPWTSPSSARPWAGDAAPIIRWQCRQRVLAVDW